MTERKVVVMVMKHPVEDRYLCTVKRKFGWVDFVMGGIEFMGFGTGTRD